MAGVNNHQIPEHVAENNAQPMDYAPYHPLDGQFASVTEDGQEGQNAHYEPYDPEEPQIPVATPPQATLAVAIPPGVPMQEMMAALVNAINRQSDLLLQQNQRYEQQNQRLEQQSRRIDAIAESRVTAQARPARRSPTPVRSRTYSRSRSPPRHRSERRSSPRRNEAISRNSTPPRRHSPRRDNPPRRQRNRSPEERDSHQGPLSRRIRELPLPRAKDLRRPKNQEKTRNHEKDEAGTSRRGNEKQKEERIKDSKPPRGKFATYTPLNASRDRIFAEVSAADFKKAGIHYPRQQPMKANTDRTKFCRYHKSHGHVTEDCVHLKDAIETQSHQQQPSWNPYYPSLAFKLRIWEAKG
ncbi:unnamed protein product [Trifolium pratense]|uniref:Uncharacterized protein n=1 Tax=Trifolium pratense TaxID=57577 RepID=A0ACB0M6N5_TRIPR|nr:unnamed protein product [Trifolium pratense]